ncbi:Protein of unknown function [Amphritea atlantica]|uniref:DUF1329 domain-containing protein n=2 Tax=Amphritea TaxID=515417 RepID=A0A1H9F0R9_9GAMM|nr:DUF1329 domain-containing protein [Amphritea atlantica]SEQ31053.1 Protein of unknown function [Amphritea atlantica]
MKNTLKALVTGVALALTSQLSLAAVDAQTAAQLNTTLTPLGAEKSGNAAGTIPEWKGGYTTVAAGYKSGEVRPDPFASDKPLFTITAANLAQYSDQLSDGVKALFAKNPDFRMNIYPTHRSAAAPEWVYSNTEKNATRAELAADETSVSGAYGGIPFPIPKTGAEVMWNHRLGWSGESVEYAMKTYIVTADGHRSLASEGDELMQFPYYYKEGDAADYSGVNQLGRFIVTGPASKAGEAILVHDPSIAGKKRAIWQYLVGQRRVRKAPSVAYDTPDFVTSGVGLFDEAFMMFGPIDRHHYKLLGKKELFIPYNNNRAAQVSIDELMGEHFLNPENVRWELHRVWVVDAELKDGMRHTVPKRTYYVDEDSWKIVLFDGWDAKGDLWRMNYSLTYLVPELPALVTNVMWGGYDLQTGAYYLNAAMNGGTPHYRVREPISEGTWSPVELANQGAR